MFGQFSCSFKTPSALQWYTLAHFLNSSIGSQDPVSSYFDSTFDGAYNLTRDAADAPNLRWGRIDYLDVTEITTRWVIWKYAKFLRAFIGGVLMVWSLRAPMLVIATERGSALRFFRPGTLSQMKEPEQMRSFIVNQDWATIPPWTGPWSPTGSRSDNLPDLPISTAT